MLFVPASAFPSTMANILPLVPLGSVTATAPATDKFVTTQKSVFATVTGVLVAVRIAAICVLVTWALFATAIRKLERLAHATSPDAGMLYVVPLKVTEVVMCDPQKGPMGARNLNPHRA